MKRARSAPEIIAVALATVLAVAAFDPLNVNARSIGFANARKDVSPAAAPIIRTGPSFGVTDTAATLSYFLDDLGGAASVRISLEWGLTADHSQTTEVFEVNSVQTCYFLLTDLNSNTTYHYRAKAIGAETAYGSDAIFTTHLTGPVLSSERYFPDTIQNGQSAEVTLTFAAPADDFNSIALSDIAPQDWAITQPGGPSILDSKVAANRVSCVWDGPYNKDTQLVATYIMTPPESAAPGNYSFSGEIKYYLGRSGPFTATVSDKSRIQLITTPPPGNAEISVLLQGDSRPDSGYNIPLTVKFFTPGASLFNDTPVYTFDLTTVKSNSTAICECAGIMPGNYDITLSSEHTLMNLKKNVVVNAPQPSIFLGTLLEGNTINDSVINISDFGVFAASFARTPADPGFNPMADFDRNGVVNISDFSLLAMNFMKVSPVEVP